MLTDAQKTYQAKQPNGPDTGLDPVPDDPNPHAELVGKCLDYLGRYKPDMDYLNTLRERLHRAYMQEPYGNEMEGRSKIVMSDVADTIEWIMPSLMRIFYGGTDVVKISGQGPEDESAKVAGPPDPQTGLPTTIIVNPAALLNEKVNHDFQRGFNGYLLLYDWFKDAMLDKMGVVKYWWKNSVQETPVAYKGLQDHELQNVLGATRFQLQDHQTMVGVDGSMTHDITGATVKQISHPMAEVLPPEEFIWDIKAKTVKQAEFACHRKRVHKTELIQKYDIQADDLDAFPQSNESFTTDVLFYERFKDLGGTSFYQDDVDPDWKIVHECYLNDYSSGKKVPMQVVLCGPKALHVEVNSYGHPPFCEITPIRVPHRAIGRSIAELVEDLQRLKTAFVRFIADNVYYQNNAQKVVNPFRINMEDALNNNYPGGIWRTKQDVDATTAVWPIPVSPLPAHAFNMVDKIDSWKENRTGVTKYNQGTDADTLNKTATGISAIMSASQQRVELIARNFAEGGVKDLFHAFGKMNIDFLQKPEAVRFNQDWQYINQDTINIDFDVQIDVALGTGTRDQTVQHLLAMLDRMIQPAFIQSGVFLPENLYNLLKTVFENMGIKQTDQYLSRPPSPQELAAQQQAQQQAQMAQMQQQQAQQQGGPGANPQMAQMAAPAGPGGPQNGSGPVG
jgi:hypothetical protein